MPILFCSVCPARCFISYLEVGVKGGRLSWRYVGTGGYLKPRDKLTLVKVAAGT